MAGIYLRNSDETTDTLVNDRHPLPTRVMEPVPSKSLPATYYASFNHAGVSGDTLELVGRDDIIIKVLEIVFTKPTASETLLIVKRRTADSGGTSTNLTPIPVDSNDPITGTLLRAYTGAPTLGTAVGTLLRMTINTGDTLFWNPPEGVKPPILRAANEVLALNIDATATVVGAITWTEEAK